MTVDRYGQATTITAVTTPFVIPLKRSFLEYTLTSSEYTDGQQVPHLMHTKQQASPASIADGRYHSIGTIRNQ